MLTFHTLVFVYLCGFVIGAHFDERTTGAIAAGDKNLISANDWRWNNCHASRPFDLPQKGSIIRRDTN
jgi:hypothetical protein